MLSLFLILSSDIPMKSKWGTCWQLPRNVCYGEITAFLRGKLATALVELWLYADQQQRYTFFYTRCHR